MKIKNIKIISLMLTMVILQTGCINKDKNFIDNSKFTLDENLNTATAVRKTTAVNPTVTQTVTTSATNLSTSTNHHTLAIMTNKIKTTSTSVISSKLSKYKSVYNTEISSEIINPDIFTTAINTTNITSYISKFTPNKNDCKIQTEVQAETSTTTVPISTTKSSITESEKILLCNLVGREYGSDYHGNTGVPVTLYERGQVVAVVMNRVASDEFPDNIYDVIMQPNQFLGYLPSNVYSYQVTQNVIDSVDYYFQHTDEYSSKILYFEGDGSYNYFH